MKFFIYQPDPPDPNEPPPTPELMAEMNTLIEDTTKAGVLIATGAFWGHPTRVNLTAGKYAVTDGPFVEAKELMGGWALINVKSLDEAIGWAKRFRDIVGEGTSEICPVMGPDDFAAMSQGQ
jgi:hypothetical protein